MVVDTILYNLITNPPYFNTTNTTIFKYNTQIFEDKHDQYIVKMLEKHYTNKNVILNFDDLLLKVENNKKITQEQYIGTKERLNHLKDYRIDVTMDNLKIETKKYIQDTLVEKFMFRCSEFLGDDGCKISHEDLLSDMDEITHIDFENDIGYFANAKNMFNDYFVNKILFGFLPLDELSFGGLPKKTLNIIYGAAHAGKTQLMIHIACTMACNGKKVAYITSELSAQMLKQRIDSWFFEKETWKINPKYMTQEQYDELIDKHDQFMSNINIKEFGTETATAFDVKNYLDRLKSEFDWDADLILVDSINQMASVKKNIPLASPHIKQKHTFTEFRALAFLLDKPVLSPTHLSDEGERAVVAGANVNTSHVGEFKMIKMVADFILGFKELYVDDAGIIYKDNLLEKCIPEDYELWETADFKKVVLLNILKSRYGSKVGDYRYLGSNIDISKFYDFTDCFKNKNKEKKKENINNTEEFNKSTENKDIFSGRKKRKL